MLLRTILRALGVSARGSINENDHYLIRRASMHGLIALREQGLLPPDAISLKWGEGRNQSFSNLDDYLTYNFYPATSAEDTRRWGQMNDCLGLAFYLQRNCLIVQDDRLNNFYRYRIYIPGQNLITVYYSLYINFIIV